MKNSKITFLIATFLCMSVFGFSRIELGIKPGVYATEKSSGGCDQGDLYFGKGGNSTLFLGAKPLISGLGREKTSTRDGVNCITTHQTEWGSGWANETRSTKCKGKKVKRLVTKVTYSSGKLKYSKTFFTGTKQVNKITCELVTIKAQSPSD